MLVEEAAEISQVWSTELSSSIQKAGAKTPAIYNPSKSETFKKLFSSTWKIQYGKGSTTYGDVGTVNVALGGLAVELAKPFST
jgi:hypothetical protein